MDIKPAKQKMSIVALDYDFNTTYDFVNVLKRKGLYSKLNFTETDVRVHFDDNIPNKEQILKEFKSNLPIISFNSLDEVNVSFAAFQRKLDIMDDNFNPENSEQFCTVAKSLLDLKISDISTIGLNFIADFHLGETKLKILNEKVETIKDFDKNITFQLILPIKYEKYIATYKIQKLISPDFSDTQNRIYQIDVNFNIDLAEKGSGEKLEIIKNCLENLKESYYVPFYNKCQEFLELHYD